MTNELTILNRLQMAAAIREARAAGRPCYVYGLCRGDTMSVFYCGKGRGSRAFAHEKDEKSSHKVHIIRKHGVGGYVLFSTHATDDEAFTAEREIIAHLRNAHLSTIVNELPGGEGFDSESARRYALEIHARRSPEARSAVARKAHAALARNRRSEAARNAALKAHETLRRKKVSGQAE